MSELLLSIDFFLAVFSLLCIAKISVDGRKNSLSYYAHCIEKRSLIGQHVRFR